MRPISAGEKLGKWHGSDSKPAIPSKIRTQKTANDRFVRGRIRDVTGTDTYVDSAAHFRKSPSERRDGVTQACGPVPSPPKQTAGAVMASHVTRGLIATTSYRSLAHRHLLREITAPLSPVPLESLPRRLLARSSNKEVIGTISESTSRA